MAQGNNRGGQRRQNQGGGQQMQRQPTENEMITIQEQRKAAFKNLISSIDRMGPQIAAVLPREYTWKTFQTVVLTAIRKNPDLLDCTVASVINACLSAAWDGLMPDGREGAMVPSRNKGVLEARWNPMVAGLRKQILKGGIVSDVITMIVYANEIRDRVTHSDGVDRARFHVSAGTEAPAIWHVPITDEAARGDPVATYAVAFFHDKRRPTFEVMYKGEIEAVRDASQSGPVWKGPFFLEMWRKTGLRRFRKSLPGGNDIVDTEAMQMFPEYSGNADLALLAPRPRPKREDFSQIEDQSGTEAGVQMDLNDFGRLKEEHEHVDRETGEVEQKSQAQAKPVPQEQKTEDKKAPKPEEKPKPVEKDTPKETSEPDKAPAEIAPKDWEAWADGIELQLRACNSVDEINTLRRSVNETMLQAPRKIEDRLSDSFMDSLADFQN